MNSKGDSQGSPITTYITITTAVIFFIMAGPCIVKKIKSFITRNKKPASPDTEKIIPLENLSTPMPIQVPNTNHGTERGRVILAPHTDYEKERLKATLIQDIEIQKEILKSITLDNLERKREASAYTKQAEKEVPASDTESYFTEDSDTDTETVQEKKHGAKGKETKE